MANDRSPTLLLDTHVAIWLVADRLDQATVDLIAAAMSSGQTMISPISAWEIGLLSNRRSSAAPTFAPSPLEWFERLVAGPLQLAPFTPAIAIGASSLPDWPHRDPADRLLVATARAVNAALVTRDQAILDYSAKGHVQTIAC